MRIILIIFILSVINTGNAATLDDVHAELVTLNGQIASLNSDLVILYNKQVEIQQELETIKLGLLPWREDSLLMLQVIMIVLGLAFGCMFWYHMLYIKDQREFW